MSKIFINVFLKPEILDSQGRAILGALERLGLSGVTDVRQGKQFLLTFAEDVSNAKMSELKKIAETLLSNPVIEDFTIEVKE